MWGLFLCALRLICTLFGREHGLWLLARKLDVRCFPPPPPPPTPFSLSLLKGIVLLSYSVVLVTMTCIHKCCILDSDSDSLFTRFATMKVSRNR